MAKLPKITFSVVLFVFQILLLALFAGYAKYKPITNSVDSTKFYPQFQDVHVMIFIGFGFLMTFLRKYGYGAVSYNFLIAAVVIQWATLVNAWVKQRIIYEEHGTIKKADVSDVNIGINELMTGDFAAAAVLITYGAVLGKASRLQILIISIVEVIFYAINEALIMEYLVIADVGGSILVHLFGAYFGITVAAVLRNYEDDKGNEAPVYHSDLFSMIGTVFLWVFWPSFNAGPLGDNKEEQQRALVNTYFSLAACVVTTFVVSPLTNKRFKLNMVHIQNATLAGGVAVGTSANLLIQPYGAILIGMLAGVLSTLGYAYITPFLTEKLKIHDTCGVNNLHGMPAILAGICGAIAAKAIDYKDYGGVIPYTAATRSQSKQAGYQMAAVLVSFTTAVVGGLITGFIVKFADGLDSSELYDDTTEYEIPDEIVSVETNGNNIELQKQC